MGGSRTICCGGIAVAWVCLWGFLYYYQTPYFGRVLRVHLRTLWLALQFHGKTSHLADPPSLDLIKRTGGFRRLNFGSSMYALDQVYHPGRITLSEQDKKAYYDEGYLVIRNALPKSTVAAMRDRMNAMIGSAPFCYLHQAWLYDVQILDFVVFGPF